MSGYRVNLAQLQLFVDTLAAFERRAEEVAARVDAEVAGLHLVWSGQGAAAHHTAHEQWLRGAAQMREALTELRAAAHTAYEAYTGAVQANLAMLR
ncbi:WXG100 family type VII secretion target [Mycobacterium sp. MYCO198283]|uniref:WXG100 family type VII secretion target n=1 Tax=Mycobacterium sp. MYCO198283 TaxID=2883505 RepID=UPI001E64132D|nr:WXG100 family type VII secretion target [Mycobacterium sp. MYCO198283]MCG5433835.1 WXG100 family type VII secretion target [Mycobacterium sp. MYCO198283]